VDELGDAIDSTCIKDLCRQDDVYEVADPAVKGASTPSWHVLKHLVDIDGVEWLVDKPVKGGKLPRARGTNQCKDAMLP
jgi:hypothetical protein